jgi:hypothetical protein
MSDDEALSAAAVTSLTTRGFDARRWKVRPFRAPHHTASAVAMVGGGTTPGQARSRWPIRAFSSSTSYPFRFHSNVAQEFPQSIQLLMGYVSNEW